MQAETKTWLVGVPALLAGLALTSDCAHAQSTASLDTEPTDSLQVLLAMGGVFSLPVPPGLSEGLSGAIEFHQLLPQPQFAPRDQAKGFGTPPTLQFSPSAVVVRRISAAATEITIPNQGITSRIEFAVGGDVLPRGLHLMTGALTPDNAWRRKLRMSVTPPALDDIGLTIGVGAHSFRRPLSVGMRHGVGDMTQWQESNSWEMDLKLAPPGSHFHYSGGVSWSDYSRQAASRLERRENPLSSRPRWQKGFSQWHKLEADLWKGLAGSGTVYAVYGSMSEAYRDLASSDSPLVFDGRTFEFGGEWKQGATRLTFSRQATTGGTLDQTETAARLRTKRFDVSFTSGSFGFTLDDTAAVRNTDRYWRAKARFALRGDLGSIGKGLFPDWASFRTERRASTFSALGIPSRKLRRKLAFGFGWSRKGSETEIDITRTVTNNPGEALAPLSHEQEFGVDFTQSFSRDWWDLSFYGSITTSRSQQNANKMLNGGASLSINRKDLPKLSVGIDISSFDLHDPYVTLRDREVSFNARLDLSRYLPATRSPEKPYLLLKAYSDWSMTRDTYSPPDVRLDPTVMLVYGTKF